MHRLSRGFPWLDAGTSAALEEASAQIGAIQRRQSVELSNGGRPGKRYYQASAIFSYRPDLAQMLA